MRACYLLLLWLLARGCRANRFTGTSLTFDPDKNSSQVVAVRYKLGFESCRNLSALNCTTDQCQFNAVQVRRVDENPGEWCQEEVTAYVRGETSYIDLSLSGLQWIAGLANNVSDVYSVSYTKLGKRNDTGRSNVSPRTTMLPVLRVPGNCHSYIRLPTFDPDGDTVTCDDNSQSYVPLPFLHVHKNCSINVDPHGQEGSYAVELFVDDKLCADVELTNDQGESHILYRGSYISATSVQFVLKVGANASCQPGEDLPLFVKPTPKDGEHLYAFVDQTLYIPINATTSRTNITGVLFSGPAGISKSGTGNDDFVLAYTPGPDDAGQRHALCFVVQAQASSNGSVSEFQSPMRCVIIVVDHVLFGLTAKFTLRSLDSRRDIDKVALPQLKRELVKRGLPADISLRVVEFNESLPLDYAHFPNPNLNG
ncbi:uncharacterized protein LOC144066233 [Stigmatopora argus]